MGKWDFKGSRVAQNLLDTEVHVAEGRNDVAYVQSGTPLSGFVVKRVS